MKVNPGYIFLLTCCLAQIGIFSVTWLASRRVQSHGWRGLLPDLTGLKERIKHACRVLQTNR